MSARELQQVINTVTLDIQDIQGENRDPEVVRDALDRIEATLPQFNLALNAVRKRAQIRFAGC